MSLIEVSAVRQLGIGPTGVLEINKTYSTTIEGVDYEDLTLARMFMLIMMKRAETIEGLMVIQMEKLEGISDDLARATSALQALADMELGTNPLNGKYMYNVLGAQLVDPLTGDSVSLLDFLLSPSYLGLTFDLVLVDGGWIYRDQMEVITEEVMKFQDTRNSTSQEMMIEVESLTRRRGDAYSLDTNTVKQLMSNAAVLAGNLN